MAMYRPIGNKESVKYQRLVHIRGTSRPNSEVPKALAMLVNKYLSSEPANKLLNQRFKGHKKITPNITIHSLRKCM